MRGPVCRCVEQSKLSGRIGECLGAANTKTKEEEEEEGEEEEEEDHNNKTEKERRGIKRKKRPPQLQEEERGCHPQTPETAAGVLEMNHHRQDFRFVSNACGLPPWSVEVNSKPVDGGEEEEAAAMHRRAKMFQKRSRAHLMRLTMHWLACLAAPIGE